MYVYPAIHVVYVLLHIFFSNSTCKRSDRRKKEGERERERKADYPNTIRNMLNWNRPCS